MAKIKVKPIPPVSDVESPSKLGARRRDIMLFKEWFSGATLTSLASKYGISRQRIGKIRRRDEWDKINAELRDREYKGLAPLVKSMYAKMIRALGTDMDRLIEKLEKNEPFTAEERKHFLSFTDQLAKSIRLDDGKPTEISSNSNVVTHRILLPPGRSNYGVIPPGPGVVLIPHEEQKKDKTPRLAVDDLVDEE